MPATRLLLIADSKMLPALASGLREGALFDVLTASLSDPAAAQKAAEKADAVALFYGAPGAALPAALQRLSPRIRERGGRILAVLQREQAAQRDDCFRAGASDLLFMPLPKEQFLARLQGAIELSWAKESGSFAPVSVATRTATSRLDQATVSSAGVESAAELPLKAGETVRLTWGAFQSWGLVVRGGPSAQIRFAGLAPDEEAQIRDWLKGGAAAPSAVAPTPPRGTAAVSSPPATAGAAPAIDAAAVQSGAAVQSVDAPTPPGGTAAVSSPPAAGRAAPALGPPPGFADRKPVRSQTRPPVRIAPPVMTAPVSMPAAEAASLSAAVLPHEPAPPPSAATNGAAGGVSSALFQEAAAASGLPSAAAPSAGAAPPPAPEAAAGPIWPVPFAAGLCKTTALQFLKDKYAPVDVPAGLVSAARKITGMLGSAERAALNKGPDSHFAEALAARIALDAATSEGVKLFSSSPPVIVDAAGVDAVLKQADEAGARLQTEANAAIGKSEIESLQIVTAASAALSRDLMTFKGTADRLRGQNAAPRLGSGALDPHLVLPGQAPRLASAKTNTGPAPVRAELRDFHDLDGGGSDRYKVILMAVVLVAFVAALGNAVFFSLPRHSELTADSAGKGVERIDVAGGNALVTIAPEWLNTVDANLPQLVSALREGDIKKAVLTLPNGKPAGVLDVATGKVTGLLRPKGAAPAAK